MNLQLKFQLLIALLMLIPNAASAQLFLDDEAPEFLPGLRAEYQTAAVNVQRLDDDIQFDWAGDAPDSRLEPGDSFSAQWSGYLQAKDNGQFQLSVYVCGRVSVYLAGEQILASEATRPQWLDCTPVELRFGQHELKIEFHKTREPARLGLYWSGPNFSLEPIAPRYLAHRAQATPDDRFELGRMLSRGLRCSACHEFDSATQPPLAAPALTHLQDNLRPSWLVERLSGHASDGLASSRMPHFGMHPNDAAAISAALFDASAPALPPESIEKQLKARNAKRGKKDPEIRLTADARQGEIDFVSIGCLACHQVSELGEPTGIAETLFGGGELSDLATKRTADFLSRWLADAGGVNAQHRMPVFDLSLHERMDLAAYLASLGADRSRNDTRAAGDVNRGPGLIHSFRCGACHPLPASLTTGLTRSRITANSDWNGGCLTSPRAESKTPGFGLSADQRSALRVYFTSVNSQTGTEADGPQLLAENNCLACHSRDLEEGLKAQLARIVETVPAVAPRLAALAPPSLTGVGDKLHEQALRDAVARKTQPLRPWLDVRMPIFDLSAQQLTTLADHLIAHDRIPERDTEVVSLPDDQVTQLAAARLVTAEGFGCQSCHQIADSQPPNVALNAHGTDLTMLGDRIRASWFQRWVRNPARIVPRMEMPAIQTPVKGVLNDSLDLQLEALWKTLNTPGFRPPRPNPVRIVRTHNLPNHTERAYLLTDVLETTETVYLRPLVFGLPNRHNLLFDLEAGTLATWWIGDCGHQHTRGKSWYWEIGGQLILEEAEFLEKIAIVDRAGGLWEPTRLGQFAARLDQTRHIENGMEWQGRIHISHAAESRWIGIRQRIFAAEKGKNALSRCVTELNELLPGDRVRLTTAANWLETPTQQDAKWRAVGLLPNAACDIQADSKLASLSPHNLEIEANSAATGSIRWTSSYQSLLPTDQFPVVELPPQTIEPRQVDVVPGFAGVQLPLPPTEMPISFAWDAQGTFYAGSLKGRVLKLLDKDGDGLEETYEVISDEIPTPFGLYAHEEGLDALAKFALLRLTPPADDGEIRSAKVVADGWGYTADYHDWAIGLERDSDGNYYMALPCQQDDRSEEAAYLRGSALQLVPYDSSEEPRQYRIEPLAAGLRFPIGIALNATGDLFTSDNQGNYNPFNELNHLRWGKRYGFINKLENKDGFSPPFESPAINLPHPWTRSVNGICFLRTPEKLLDQAPAFGPFEGHLVGCEMNGKSLVRMSLQKVGGTYQGAAYMFSRLPEEGETGLEGPIVCEVAPTGDLFVGSLQDSGWSGGANTGSIVRFRPGDLPLGIAEIRANATGFDIDFTGPVNSDKALDKNNYAIRSYRRISTPAYGGDDQDEKTERIHSISLSPDRRRIALTLGGLREGCVYEFNLLDIGDGQNLLFPSQAHYTMRSIPE